MGSHIIEDELESNWYIKCYSSLCSTYLDCICQVPRAARTLTWHGNDKIWAPYIKWVPIEGQWDRFESLYTTGNYTGTGFLLLPLHSSNVSFPATPWRNRQPCGVADMCGAAYSIACITSKWRHNGHDGVSNHQPHDCLRNRLFRRRSKKTSKLSVTGLCARNSPVTGEFPAQRASNAEKVSIWWRHHEMDS